MTHDQNVREMMGSHAAVGLGGENLLHQIQALAALDPALSRSILQDGLGGIGAHGVTDAREATLQVLAMLIAIGDAENQIDVYQKAAALHGATDDEIIDVVNLASSYVGNPRAVTAARAMASYLTTTRKQKLPDVTEILIHVGDHDTMIWDNGKPGVPMVLIHALCMDHRFWREIYADLAAQGRVIAYDLRGHGYAQGAPLTKDLDQLADDARTLLDQLGVKQADVYGASYGGAVAEYLAVGHPERVRSLALLATSTKGDLKELGGRADAAEQHGMEAQVSKSIIRWFLPETIAENTWAVRYARERVRAARVEEWAAAWRAMARLDVVESAKSLNQPTLILSGKQDLSSTPEVMEFTAKSYKNGKLVSIDPGTHFMPIEQPKAVADALVAFRKEVDTSKSI